MGWGGGEVGGEGLSLGGGEAETCMASELGKSKEKIEAFLNAC